MAAFPSMPTSAVDFRWIHNLDNENSGGCTIALDTLAVDTLAVWLDALDFEGQRPLRNNPFILFSIAQIPVQ